MSGTVWSDQQVREWIASQATRNPWYQSICVRNEISTPGTVNAEKRLRLLDLPDDLKGKTVLDVGCNSGQLCFEAKRRNAGRVVGVDVLDHRLAQARTLAEIMELDIKFRPMSLYDIAELGPFDLVFCTAVVTEITDLIRGLEALKNVTGGTLYVELAVFDVRPPGSWAGALVRGISRITRAKRWRRGAGSLSRETRNFAPRGSARLRQIKAGMESRWALVPDRQFIESVMGDGLHAEFLGASTRYEMFKFTRRAPSARARGEDAE